VVKGLISFGGSPRNFLKVGYLGFAGDKQPVTAEIGVNAVRKKVSMQYSAEEGCHALEVWALPAGEAASLPTSIRQAIERGTIVLDPALLPGNPLDYQPVRIKSSAWETGDANDPNHPLRPARVGLTFQSASGKSDGPHQVAFKMIRRGFQNYRSDRWGNNPHGGTGSTESILFFNDESNDPDHISRKPGEGFPVKYMMYVRFGPGASIGIHRHQGNVDSFWITRGSGMGVVADAVELDGAERTVELRRIQAFEGMIVRPGQMHGLLRDTEDDLEMFALGAAN